jgi:hypothetical protein
MPKTTYAPRQTSTVTAMSDSQAEARRLEESRLRQKHWKRWGPYLSERAWGSVREDYSPGGTAWDYFPHDHARSRAYRWNEDGLGGFCDRHQHQSDPHWRDLILFHEYFHGDNGAGIGASHQTGWTALVAKLLQQSGD